MPRSMERSISICHMTPAGVSRPRIKVSMRSSLYHNLSTHNLSTRIKTKCPADGVSWVKH